MLPCYLGDPEPDLERVFPPVGDLVRELWIVTHGDLRNTARVRAFLDIVGTAILHDKALLEGKAAHRAPAPPERRRRRVNRPGAAG